MFSNRKKALLFWPLACAGVPVVCGPLVEWLIVSSIGRQAFLAPLFALGTTAGLSLLLFLPAIVGLAFERVRSVSAMLAICFAAHFAGFIVSAPLSHWIRMDAFVKLGERSKPLVAAIRTYQQEYGRPPESLSALVPKFLPSIPTTGMGAYPKYEYLIDQTNYYGNPWVLRVHTPTAGINFDQFLYFPLTNYPATGYGGVLRRVGDWAYVFE